MLYIVVCWTEKGVMCLFIGGCSYHTSLCQLLRF